MVMYDWNHLTYQEIRQSIDEFSDFLQCWSFMQKFVSMAIKHDFLKVL